jgi:thiamine pyrophosphate-dependent acetolactate synthase large subunit-like protein
LNKNRRPNLGVLRDPALFLRWLTEVLPQNDRWKNWREQLRQRDETREQEICQQAQEPTELLNPVHLCREIEKNIPSNSIIVADGGDFVATASYIVSPPGPLTWLDPGVFGTLGVGAGFALGAKLCHPDSEVWILFGDGSVGYSLSEFDTFVRHQIPVLAVVGNDAGWTQIAREQVEMLKDDVGTVLRHTNYHVVAEGFGGKGFLLNEPNRLGEVLQQARKTVSENQPVLVNAHLGKTAFRKGSISI